MIANTWASVYRGDDANEYGDTTDLDQPVTGLERVPMAITEQSKTVYDRETSEARTVRFAIGRCRSNSDVKQGDRILDLRTNRWWVARSVSDPGSTFSGFKDLNLDLRAV